MAMLNNQMLIQLVFQGLHQEFSSQKGPGCQTGPGWGPGWSTQEFADGGMDEWPINLMYLHISSPWMTMAHIEDARIKRCYEDL